MAGNKSNCSSLKEKLTKNFLGATSKKIDLEVLDLSTKSNISVNANFCPVSKKSYKKRKEKSELKLTESPSVPEVAAQPVNESRSLVDKELKSIESTKDANTVLKPSKSISDFITTPNRKVPGEFAFKRKTNNTSSVSEKNYKSDKCKETGLKLSTSIRPYKSQSTKNLIVSGDSQKVISREDKLKRNKTTETLEKDFACDKCEKRFSHNRLLKRHYRIHTDERPFECDKCKKTYKRNWHLTRHYQTHTNEKPFVCGVCRKGFAQKNNLVVHERTHTGEKPYECGICKKRFSQTSSLIAHNRTHTNEKPFGCALCEKRYKNRKSLIFHLRKHISEKP